MLKEAAKLRMLLHQMEAERELTSLTVLQRDVLYAAIEVAGADNHSSLKNIFAHPLVKDIPRPTYYRALQCLISFGRLERVGSHRSGVYKVLSM